MEKLTSIRCNDEIYGTYVKRHDFFKGDEGGGLIFKRKECVARDFGGLFWTKKGVLVVLVCISGHAQ